MIIILQNYKLPVGIRTDAEFCHLCHNCHIKYIVILLRHNITLISFTK